MELIKDSVVLEITDKLADGGMGSVYKALQKGVEGFKKTVAIKTLLPELTSDDMFVKRFIDEAMLVANLVHENIVQIYQLGSCEGNYYFVLEYVDGISLHDFLEFHWKLNMKIPRELAVFIASRIARGLSYAHSRTDSQGAPMKIVHCDVCPNNILINTEGLPKLTDFGIARAANVLADDNSVSGKLPFMSPEQASRKEVDFRSDIYSLGIVLFNMLSGKLTRDVGASFEEIIRQARESYIAWERLPDDVDADLRAILEKMMARDPSGRYAATQELARELEYYIYKDGYGPTIVTLAEYLRKNLPYLYENENAASSRKIDGLNRTVKMEL